jgi:hypothetical protein
MRESETWPGPGDRPACATDRGEYCGTGLASRCLYCDMGAFMPICVISVAMCNRPRFAPFLRQQVPQHPSARCPAEYCAAMPEKGGGGSGASASGWRPRPGAAGNDAATADPQHAGLAADAEPRCAIDHFLRATLAHRGMRCRATGQQTRLAERAGYRSRDRGPRGAAKAVRSIVLQRQLSDLRMQGLHVDDRLRLGFRRRAKYRGRAFKTLIAPLLDLVGVSGTQTCPASNRWTSKSCASSTKIFSPLIAATGAFAFNAGLAVPARSSCHGHLLARGNHAAVARKIHLSRAVSFPEPPLCPVSNGFNAKIHRNYSFIA